MLSQPRDDFAFDELDGERGGGRGSRNQAEAEVSARSITICLRRDSYDAYEAEAETLGRIGRLFVEADLPRIEVRLPRDLAEAALFPPTRAATSG